MSVRFDILSLFPEYFASPFSQSIILQARKKGLVSFGFVDIRAFATNKHRRVDDRPYGGRPGMVLQPEPVAQAIRSVRTPSSRVIYLTPQGAPLTTEKCRSLARCEHLVLLCGHYEGVDQRVIDSDVDEEISIGDYILTNGCLPAIVLVDAVLRFVPGVLGNPDSLEYDTFSYKGGVGPPVFTRPEVFEGISVPEQLLSGNHRLIEEFEEQTAKKKAGKFRPDLLAKQRI